MRLKGRNVDTVTGGIIKSAVNFGCCTKEFTVANIKM